MVDDLLTCQFNGKGLITQKVNFKPVILVLRMSKMLTDKKVQKTQ